MTNNTWTQTFPGAITVCDREGTILEMNDRSAEMFAAEGGRQLIGSSVLDCHPEPARAKLRRMMEAQQANVYSIEKNGARKLVYQTPWYDGEQYGGFVELVLDLPGGMPHFVRG